MENTEEKNQSAAGEPADQPATDPIVQLGIRVKQSSKAWFEGVQKQHPKAHEAFSAIETVYKDALNHTFSEPEPVIKEVVKEVPMSLQPGEFIVKKLPDNVRNHARKARKWICEKNKKTFVDNDEYMADLAAYAIQFYLNQKFDYLK